ncbi:MAG: DUF115 domain-containing protein [Candidatus Aminicenantes bacterium]|nr:DUF115 domain-containing protein [Candidatus Aminicenantes bacterium]
MKTLNRIKIRLLKSKYANERCVIIGNGPSLKKHDLRKLDNEYVFIVNRGYFAYKLGLKKADFFIVSDPFTYDKYRSEIDQADVRMKFYRDNVCKDCKKGIILSNINNYEMHQGHFSKDLQIGINSGHSVVLDAIQVCFYMGFSEVYLIGCDFDYSQKETHFYGAGELETQRKAVMPIEKVFSSFKVANEVFLKHKRQLFNASKGGALEELCRVEFDKVFNGKTNIQ